MTQTKCPKRVATEAVEKKNEINDDISRDGSKRQSRQNKKK